jgi:uncharacterized protein
MTSREILDTLATLKDELRVRYHVRALFLFGSVARNEGNAASDIDLLADFDETADLFHLMGATIFLEERLGCKVDVVPRQSLREELRPRVLAEAIAI